MGDIASTCSFRMSLKDNRFPKDEKDILLESKNWSSVARDEHSRGSDR